jgi:hypothetical protein
MNIETLIASLENKVTALESKKQTALGKGAFELFSVFDKETIETSITLHLIKKASEEIKVYRAIEVKEKLKSYLLESLPDLAFYFRQESINKVVSDSLDTAFSRLTEEDFLNKIVNMVEGGNGNE